MTITPAQAAKWLAVNTCNRPMSETVWTQYAVDMLDGRFEWNSSGPSQDYVLGEALDYLNRRRRKS